MVSAIMSVLPVVKVKLMTTSGRTHTLIEEYSGTDSQNELLDAVRNRSGHSLPD